MQKLPLYLFFFILVFSSCNSYRIVQDKAQNRKFFNVTYGNDKKHKMDVFVPAQLQDSAFVVMIHGGGWRFGSKSHLRSVQRYLMKNGIASTSLNYRLANKKINYYHQLEDVETAFNFIVDSLKNNRKIVLLGESSGGHIALLYAYQNPEKIDKVITFAAPTDFYSKDLQKTKFYHWYSKSAFSRAVGEKYKWRDSIPKSFEIASPISHVSDVTTYLFQGTWDILVNKNQAITLDSVLNAKGLKHELILIKGANHTPRLMPRWRKMIYNKVLDIVMEK